jgi:hypothetical protein
VCVYIYICICIYVHIHIYHAWDVTCVYVCVPWDLVDSDARAVFGATGAVV